MRKLITAGTLRFLHVLLCLSAPALGACGGDDTNSPVDPEPLAVTAASPEDGANDVETGAQVIATFNRGMDPATLTPESFVLRAGGTPLGTNLTYDADTRTARLVGPLLPGTLYQVELTTGITDDEGSALSAAQEWSFTTRTWQAAAVDQAGTTGFNTSLLVDGSGQLHLAYADLTDLDLKYATCVADCTTAANWTATTVDDAGSAVSFASLALDGSGGLHLTYHISNTSDIKYAACADACTTPGNWSTGVVGTAGSFGPFGSLTVGENGRLHAGYYDPTSGELKYATCGGDCTTAANWTSVGVDQTLGGGSASIAVDGTGRLHVSYVHPTSADLKYATCGAGCTTGANWTAIIVYDGGSGKSSLVVDGSGAVHVSFIGGESDLRYASCPGLCGTGSNWTALAVDTAGAVGGYTSLVLDGSGRRHVSYYDFTNQDLKYATCAADCTAAESWQSAAVDQAGDVGTYTSLAVDGAGRVHVSYYDAINGDLKYIE